MQPHIVYVVLATGLKGDATANVLGVYSTRLKAAERALRARPDENYGAEQVDVDLVQYRSDYSTYVLEIHSIEVDANA